MFKPYRLFLRLTTAALLGILLIRSGVSRRALGTVMCSLLLTYSEDAVTLINRHGSMRQLLQRTGLLRKRAAPPSPPAVVRWQLDVQGMRCQACAARVRTSVAVLPGVRNATVELGEGRVEVWAESGGPVTGDVLKGTISGIDDAYAVAVTSRDCFTADGTSVTCTHSFSGGAGIVGGSTGRLTQELQLAEMDSQQQQVVEQQVEDPVESSELHRRQPGAAGCDAAGEL